MFAEIDISSFSNLRLTSTVARVPATQVPEGLARGLAPAMHLVDVCTGMPVSYTHLTLPTKA